MAKHIRANMSVSDTTMAAAFARLDEQKLEELKKQAFANKRRRDFLASVKKA